MLQVFLSFLQSLHYDLFCNFLTYQYQYSIRGKRSENCKIKKYSRIGALRRKQNIWVRKQRIYFKQKTQKEGDADDLVDTDTSTDTDMSETNKRDHGEESE